MMDEKSHEDILFEKAKIIEEGNDPKLRPKDENRVGYSMYYESPENGPFIRAGAGIVTQPNAVGYGEPGMNTNPRVPIRCWPHRHHAAEYFVHFGIDPDKPDDLGGTIEFWVGDGDNATGFTFSKPATIYVPPRVGHLPCVFREVRKPFIHIEWLDFPIWSQGIAIPKVSRGFHLEGPQENISELGIYQECFSERDISKAAYFPAHEGKAHVVLQHGMREYETAPHFMEINMIYGSGIGWGMGDIMQYPDRQEISLPHKHAVEELYLFLGTDKDHTDELGATVEFWMDDGSGEKEYIITKPTLISVPPFATHEPLYVKEVNSPFFTVAVLNMPVWAGIPAPEFPRKKRFFRG